MIQNDNEYIFTIDNDSIRASVPFDLSDEECESIANDLDSRFEGFVSTWAKEWRVNHPSIANQCEVRATFERQVWGGWNEDYALTIGEIEFECQDALDQFKLSDLPPHYDCWGDSGDSLFFESVRLGLVPDWDGPFECVMDEEQYEMYLDDRVLREYGYEPRKED